MADELARLRDDPTIAALLARSNRLGADKRVTNFAGGNTSAKLTLADPITGAPTRVLAVKGSGGDLGTMTVAGLAFLDLDRVRALERVHASGVHEDDIVDYYEYCRFGHGGAVPSIDTPLHAFIAQDHVDHLHPDSMIALAAADDSEALVAECYGDEVGWLPWKRPGSSSGSRSATSSAAHPDARGAVLEGHGMICWADTSEECEALSLDLIARAERFLAASDLDGAFGAVAPGYTALPDRRAPAPGRRARTDRARHRRVGASDGRRLQRRTRRARLPLPRGGTAPCRPGHVVPRPLPAHEGAAAVPRPAGDGDRSTSSATASVSCTTQYRADYRAYYDAYADEGSPAMRGADPVIVLVPGVGMWSFGADPQTARVAGEFYINAINVMRGAEAVSTYTPIDDREKFRIEYWELEERKLRMRPPAPLLQGRVALVTGAASGIGRAIAELLAGNGACVVVADLDGEGAEKVAAALGAERALGLAADVTVGGAGRGDVRCRGRTLRRGRHRRQQRRLRHRRTAGRDVGRSTGTGSTPCSPAARSSSAAEPPAR